MYGGIALFLNIVIGAGLLVLPGLAYQQVGNLAVLSWMVCSLLGLPLLLVFIVLGKYYPDSGGISHYAFRAFGGWMQRVSAFLFLGAVVLGLPSIAMTGGYYLNAIYPYSVHFYAAALIVIAAFLHFFSGGGVSRILEYIGSSVIFILLILLVISILGIDLNHGENINIFLNLHIDSKNASIILTPFMMIFFAFTGWEVGAHAAEEFKNPSRDFPLAMLFSFGIATIFYLLIAWVVQTSNIKSGFESPFLEITRPILGFKGGYLVSFIAGFLILANLFGAIWGVSRLVYSLGRDQILPSLLSVLHNGSPLIAVFVVVISLLVIVFFDFYGFVHIKDMLSLAGQNFLLLYGVAAASLWRLSSKTMMKILSAFVLLLVLGLLFIAGVHIIYPTSLITLASVSQWIKYKKNLHP